MQQGPSSPFRVSVCAARDPNTDYKTRVCCRTIDAYEAFASAERTITVFPARPAQTVFASWSVLATTLNAARQSRVTLSLWT